MDGRRAGGGLATVIVVILAILYFSGSLDPTLYKVGLNFKPCAQNAFGAVYCGKALTEYNEHIEGVQQEVRGAVGRLENCERYPAGGSC